ncbi:restriction endonuclease [Candidatus Poribacteria bacterium]|nr:MAG: restriction endonuclease [Candidatus Poribacteria bacterium]
METVTKKVWSPSTEQVCEIELPAESIVETALLELDYPVGGLHKRKIAEALAERFSLTDEQTNAKLKSENGPRAFNFHVGKVTGTLIRSGKMMKTKSGRRDINREQVSEEIGVSKQDSDDSRNTPEKSIERNYQLIRRELATELLQKIKNNTPTFFEKLVIDLLFKMGYGGSREDAQAVGRSGDGGIDGIIKADPLGLNVVYIQAKRWEGNVGAPPVRDFVGALDGEGVQDGIFITTSDFNPAAKEFAERSSKRVILINGSQLARYMIDHNVGVSVEKTYEIKRVDSDYFTENAEDS